MNLFGLTFSASDLWFLGIAGALATILINYWLNNTRDKIARRATAAAKFNSEILNILSGLYPLPSDWPDNINMIETRLRFVFPKMQIAIEEFNFFLPWYKKVLLNRDWSRFRNAYGRNQDMQCYHHYMPFGSNPNYKENFKHNVDRLLKYAKTT